jgi:O-succinylhomoserine sulfhydrylase
VDATDTKGFEEAVQENTRMLFAESPSNPGLDIVDLGALGEIARRHSLIFNVDNCFATPYLQRPAELGAHVVTHSATKFIDGQGRVLGGAVLGSEELIEKAMFLSRHTGPALSPFNAWLLSKSLETLAVRMEAHCRNAQALAERLTENPNINWVKYPFLDSHPQHELARQQMKLGGGLLTFEVKGGLEEGKRFLDGLEMLSLSSNLGDTRSIATHPSSTTHSARADLRGPRAHRRHHRRRRSCAGPGCRVSCREVHPSDPAYGHRRRPTHRALTAPPVRLPPRRPAGMSASQAAPNPPANS